jgi:hypothetical protein
MKYGKAYNGKLHKINPHNDGISKCGLSWIEQKYNDITLFGTDELCKRCFKGELGNHKLKMKLKKIIHLEEELFKI